MHTNNKQASFFSPLNTYFDAIFVITMEQAEARQNSIKKHMEGLNYAFWPATDKNKLDPSILSDTRYYDDEKHRNIKRTHRSMTLAEYACASSHRSIYEHMLAKNLSRVLIFEDDAIPNVDVLKHFTERMSTLSTNWDVVLFDYYDCHYESVTSYLKQGLYKLYHKLGISNWQKVPLSLINNMLMQDYNTDFYRAGRLSGSHAYCLTLNAAKHYANFQSPVVLQPDRVFYYYQAEHPLNVFACKQAMFLRGEESNTSQIQQ
ncbi:glycosyltransferase family 25 protein [Agaribacter flavus]|uniref:Glycosyltransferase family 25 protein n=1 Tax=Agaribacter flavus TaxID=1902781 RepID=A0ABV7FWJ0_9ALTE